MYLLYINIIFSEICALKISGSWRIMWVASPFLEPAENITVKDLVISSEFLLLQRQEVAVLTDKKWK